MTRMRVPRLPGPGRVATVLALVRAGQRIRALRSAACSLAAIERSSFLFVRRSAMAGQP